MEKEVSRPGMALSPIESLRLGELIELLDRMTAKCGMKRTHHTAPLERDGRALDGATRFTVGSMAEMACGGALTHRENAARAYARIRCGIHEAKSIVRVIRCSERHPNRVRA